MVSTRQSQQPTQSQPPTQSQQPTQPQQPTGWSGAVLHAGVEFGPTPLTVLTGAIPPGLRGSLYRNGPGTLDRGGERVGHWFDGDGAILGIQFQNQGAIGIYRYVQTKGYQQETQAGKFLLGGYGMLPAGRVWERWGKALKNAANTSVLALPDRLLALWEGGPPHALRLDSLETIGLDELDGLQGLSYSAHPKVDPQTGDIFNFGVSLGATATLNLYRSDRSGHIHQKGTISLSGLPLVHDCVMAGRYLIFCVPPVRISALPVLLQLKSFSDATMWRPAVGTEIVVVDRATLDLVCRIQTEPWFQWHFGNGYELPDGSVVLHIVRYADFQINQRLKEIATGRSTTIAAATFWQLRLDPAKAQVLEMQELLDRSCEFPVGKPHEAGQPFRDTYLSLHRQETDICVDLFDTIAHFDHTTGQLTEADLGTRRYPSEPIYAPDAETPNSGWLLTLVYDGNTDESQIWVYAADRLDDEPVCRLALPQVVPLGFHGTWQPAP